jgi:glycine cleavage system H protein
MVLYADRLYSEFHFWVKQEEKGTVIGMTEYACTELGEVDYLELPEPGDRIVRNRSFGVAETSKALTELVAPLSGEVIETNARVMDAPETLGHDPYGAGWLIRIAPSDVTQMDDLMSPEAYHDLMKSRPVAPNGADTNSHSNE